MAKLFFVGGLVFALAGPLGAQSVTLNVCNAGKADIDAFAARENSAVVMHIVPDTCVDIYSETTGAPASVGFVLTDTRGQWGAARRLDLIPDVGNALPRVAGNVTVRRGNQNVTAQAQLSFRPPTPKCVRIQSSTNARDNLPANATTSQRTQAEISDAAGSANAGKTVCDHFVYRLNAVAYPDTRELSFEEACARCPLVEEVNFPLPDAAAEQAMRELFTTGKSDIASTFLLDQMRIRRQRPEAQPVTWPVLLPALAKTGWITGPPPPWMPRYVVLRGTVSRVEVSPPGASVSWVNLAFREAPVTPDSRGKLHDELNVCTSDPEIFQEVFGADFRTSMVGKAIEVEGEIQRSYCQGLKGNIRVTLAHQVRAVQSALFDAATLAAAPAIVPKPDVLPERYHDPDLPNYDVAKSTAQNQINEFCRRIYNYGENLTAEQIQFRNANQAAVDAEVKKCVSEFDAAEAAQHRRIAIRYCLANDYTLARASSNAYDECMQKNDVLTGLCSAAQKVSRKGANQPNAAEQKCPAARPNGREIRVISNGTPLDGEVKPIVIPPTGPGLPAILLAPMEPGMIQRAFPPAASPNPTPAAAPARASTPVAAPAPQRQQAQQQVADRQARGQQYTTCLQQAAKDYPRGSADLTKAVAACVQILQGK